VVSITPPKKVILLNDGELPYDTLIIAVGSVTKLFKCDDNFYNLINFFRMNSTNDLNQTKKPKVLKK